SSSHQSRHLPLPRRHDRLARRRSPSPRPRPLRLRRHVGHQRRTQPTHAYLTATRRLSKPVLIPLQPFAYPLRSTAAVQHHATREDPCFSAIQPLLTASCALSSGLCSHVMAHKNYLVCWVARWNSTIPKGLPPA